MKGLVLRLLQQIMLELERRDSAWTGCVWKAMLAAVQHVYEVGAASDVWLG